MSGMLGGRKTLQLQPIIMEGQDEPGMFDFFKKYPWFLEVHRYPTATQLLADLDERVIGPLEAKVAELRPGQKCIAPQSARFASKRFAP
jgi:hypothetical protein